MASRSGLLKVAAGLLGVALGGRVDSEAEVVKVDEGDDIWPFMESRKHCVAKAGHFSLCAAATGRAHVAFRTFCLAMGGDVKDNGCVAETDYDCGVPIDDVATFVERAVSGKVGKDVVTTSGLEFFLQKFENSCKHVEGLGKVLAAMKSVPNFGSVGNASVNVPGRGDWDAKYAECPGDHWVVAARQKVEGDRGWLRDDTAMNAVEFKCSDGTILKSKEGRWGGWSGWKHCDSKQHVVGFAMKSEDLGHRDDTTANAIRLTCSTYGHTWPRKTMELDNNGPWGRWHQAAECPIWQYVCGLKTMVQSYQGLGSDDTALGNVEVKCCTYSIGR